MNAVVLIKVIDDWKKEEPNKFKFELSNPDSLHLFMLLLVVIDDDDGNFDGIPSVLVLVANIL